jgi:hypothetical protein
MRRALIRLTLLIALLGVRLGATAIALIVTQRFIAIAADSKVVDANLAFVRNTCKIRQAGGIYYISVNFVLSRSAGYDLDQIVLGINAGSIEGTASKLMEAVPGPLRTALIDARNEDPVAFKKNFANGQALGVALAGFEDRAPAMVFVGFTMKDITKTNLRVDAGTYRCPGDCPDGHTGLFVPARLQTLFEQQHPRYWMGEASDVAKNAEEFIKLAMAQRLPDVGPPISVLVLDSSGAQLLKPGACKP